MENAETAKRCHVTLIKWCKTTVRVRSSKVVHKFSVNFSANPYFSLGSCFFFRSHSLSRFQVRCSQLRCSRCKEREREHSHFFRYVMLEANEHCCTWKRQRKSKRERERAGESECKDEYAEWRNANKNE